MDFVELRDQLRDFVSSQGWDKVGTSRPQIPRNLAMSIVLEASELLEHFQWGEEVGGEALAEEIADVVLYSIRLADVLDIDIEQAIKKKLVRNLTRSWE